MNSMYGTSIRNCAAEYCIEICAPVSATFHQVHKRGGPKCCSASMQQQIWDVKGDGPSVRTQETVGGVGMKQVMLAGRAA